MLSADSQLSMYSWVIGMLLDCECLSVESENHTTGDAEHCNFRGYHKKYLFYSMAKIIQP